MTSPVTAATPPPPAAQPKTGIGRVIGALVALVIGSLLASGAVSLVVAGGTVAWAAGQSGADGYFQTPPVAVGTTTYALVSPPIDMSGDSNSRGGGYMGDGYMGDGYMENNYRGDGYLGDGYMGDGYMGDMGYLGSGGSTPFNLGSLRLSAESATEGTPLFIGVAPSDQVNAYLADVSHAVVTRANMGPGGTSLSVIEGSQSPSAPTQEDFWTLSATGTGEQNLVWTLQDLAAQENTEPAASYTLVVMNADGSQTVNVDLRGGARSDLIAPLGWGLLIGGLALLLVALLLLALGTVLLVRQPVRRTAAGPDAAATSVDSVHL